MTKRKPKTDAGAAIAHGLQVISFQARLLGCPSWRMVVTEFGDPLVHSPKFTKNQKGVLCLNRDKVAGVSTTKMGGKQVNVYTCLRHWDALQMSEEPRVRAQLKNQ